MSKNHKILKIGLTGGIGSGKSTVAKIFEDQSIYVIDTDDIAKKIIIKNSYAYKKIINHFSVSILDSEQNINRKKLAKLVFADSNLREWLEQLLHPLIWEEVEKQFSNASSNYILIVVPLLLETGLNKEVDRVLVVDVPRDLQKSRVVERDGRSSAEIEQIISAQCSPELRKKMADDIIINDRDIDHLKKQVIKLNVKYQGIANKYVTSR